MALSSAVRAITDRSLREHLQDRHDQVMKRYRNEMMKLFLEACETKVQESRLFVDTELTQLSQDQRSLPADQRLNPTMLQVMESHLELISQKVACIYKIKALQQ